MALLPRARAAKFLRIISENPFKPKSACRNIGKEGFQCLLGGIFPIFPCLCLQAVLCLSLIHI